MEKILKDKLFLKYISYNFEADKSYYRLELTDQTEVDNQKEISDNCEYSYFPIYSIETLIGTIQKLIQTDSQYENYTLDFTNFINELLDPEIGPEIFKNFTDNIKWLWEFNELWEGLSMYKLFLLTNSFDDTDSKFMFIPIQKSLYEFKKFVIDYFCYFEWELKKDWFGFTKNKFNEMKQVGENKRKTILIVRKTKELLKLKKETERLQKEIKDLTEEIL